MAALVFFDAVGLLAASTETMTIENPIAVGYYIRIDTSPIQLKQDLTSDAPLTTYAGCTTLNVLSTFPARLSVKIRATSQAGGNWTAYVRPASLPKGQSRTRVCVKGEGIDQTVFQAGSKVKVAEVTVIVMPN